MEKISKMLIGIGDSGGHVLEMLVRTNGFKRIVATDINEDWAYRKTSINSFGAAQLGFYPEIVSTKFDLFNIDQSAEIIAKYKPAIICSAATLQSWCVINTLPSEVFEELDLARFGPWLPMHLTLVYKLMQEKIETLL